MKEVPIHCKVTLTIEEAAAYSNIGVNRLRKLTDEPNSDMVLWVGNRRLIKRKQLDDFISRTYSI